MWSNDIKCKYMFMFPLKNLARKELIVCLCLSKLSVCWQRLLAASAGRGMFPWEKKMATVTSHCELMVSSQWAHRQLTVSSRWPKWSQPAVTEPWLSCDLAVTRARINSFLSIQFNSNLSWIWDFSIQFNSNSNWIQNLSIQFQFNSFSFNSNSIQFNFYAP